jgi:hypothetical protein
MIIFGYPLLVPELNWMLVGEKMGEGLLYSNVWTTLEPLSAGVYYFLESVFNRSVLPYQIMALILTFSQAMILNLILHFHNSYSDRTYIPSLLYLLFSSLFFDFYTLSPVLMGVTFLLPALSLLIGQNKSKNLESIFYVGLLIGVASLFYLPLAMFLVMVILSFVLIFSSSLRLYLILIMGFTLPFSFVLVYFLYQNGLQEFYSNFIYSFFTYPLHSHMSFKDFAIILIIPAILLIFSILFVFNTPKYVNNQYLIFRLMGLWLVAASLSLFFSKHLYPHQFYVFVPALAYFGTHFFLLLKKKLLREVFFLIGLASIVLVSYGSVYKYFLKKHPMNLSDMIIPTPKKGEGEIENRKTMLLGEDISVLKNAKLATPYLDWELSRRHFENLDNYYNISKVFENIQKDKPEIIIDQKELAEYLFYRIPSLKEDYVNVTKNKYVRKDLYKAEVE